MLFNFSRNAIAFALLLTLGFGCTEPTVSVMPQKIFFNTSDGVVIVGNLYQAGSERFAIYLHMMPSTKEGWDALATKLASEQQVTGLAIDERGHGESTMNGTLNYQTFTEEQQQAKILDVEAAFGYLKTLGATEENTVVIGGSIGANLAIWFMTRHPQMKKAIALSPGLLYRGVSTDDKIIHLHDGQRVLLVASDDDSHGAYEGVQKLHELNPSQTEMILFSGVGHAETMLEKQADLTERIITWLY